MSPEIRVKKPQSFIKRSFRDSILITIVAGIALYFFLQIPQAGTTGYKKEYDYLEQTGQLLITDTPLTDTKYEKVHVQSVIDGSTITVKVSDGTELKVAYIGIGTSDLESMKMNNELVAGKDVYLQKDKEETDEKGSALRYVYLDNGAMVNYILIRLGYAIQKTIPPNVAFQQQLYAGQELAKAEKRNLFQ